MRHGLRRCAGLLVMVACLGAASTASAQMFPQSVASGDPRPDSVVLWTRLDNPAMPDALRVEIATDEGFQDIVASRDLVAEEMYGWAVKVRIDGLEPYTTYYYRFVYGSGAAMETSPVGRTKTAPSADMDVPVRFAVVYCQDYIDRYYNAFAKLLRDHDEDIDFVVHLGDVIYEHTGGSVDLPAQTDRTIVFEDPEGTVPYGEFAAAGSLSNYRDIYRTYRSDPVYRQVHERWPMIAIWDDHEFSNDHWGATATYTNGREDEYEPDRRRNAEQAFFEWVPIDAGLGADGTLDIGADDLYPNTRIYRDFLFGQHLQLAMTDYRTYRPDHLVPEDAFPGTIAVDEAGMIELLTEPVWDAVRGQFDPYVDMDLLASFLPIFKQTATLIAANAYAMENPALDLFDAVAIADQALTGNISTTYLNALFDAAGLAPPFTDQLVAGLPRGISYLYVGKTAMYSSSGSRTQVLWDPYNLLAAHLYLTTAGAAQEAYGGQQTAWLQGTMLQSPATWKVLGSSVMLTPLLVDFTNPLIASQLPDDFPDQLRTRLGITMDQWDGFPQKKLELLGLLGVVPNAVVISGDIHATFVTDHGNGVFEFTPPSVSSATLGDFIERGIMEDPILGQIPGLDQLIAQIDLLLQISTLDDTVTQSDIVYAHTAAHGFMVMEADADALHAVISEISSEEIHTDHTSDPQALDDLFTTISYRVEDGELFPGD